MSILSRIVEWNKERLLLKTPKDVNLEVESSFIVEELLEMNTNLLSDEANERARKLVKKEILEEWFQSKPEQVVDAAADIIVFATGLIAKMWYDPDVVMDEVLKEIESRKWEIIDWKFVKFKDEEAKKNWYKADFLKAKKCD